MLNIHIILFDCTVWVYMTKRGESGSEGSPDENRTINCDIDRRDLLKTTGTGILGITSLGHASTTGGVSADEDPTPIEDWHDLDAIRTDLGDILEYTLVADLDAETAGYDEHVRGPANGWKPIGLESLGGFIGIFDGNGHRITDLIINRPNERGIGLFARSEAGTIQNLSIRAADITGEAGVGAILGGGINCSVVNADASGSISGDTSVGGLVGGLDESEVTESYATGTVSGDTSVGGLVGQTILSRVSKSYATSEVSADTNVGGLAGRIDDSTSVEESYATGAVSGDTSVGGLVGRTATLSTVSESYATGSTTGTEDVGGLIGEFSSGDVTDSYWDVPATGQEDPDPERGGTGLGDLVDDPPTDEMTGADAEANMDGFDFDETWDVVTSPDDYPALEWQEIEPSIFEQRVAGKLETAEEIDDVAVFLSESDDVESVIDGIRDALNEGDLDEETADQAVLRLNLGEDISRRLLYKTSDKSREVADDEQIAVDTTKFSVDLAVSLGLIRLAITDTLTNFGFGFLVPDSEILREKLDIAIEELISYTFSRARQGEALSEVNRIVQEAYDRILADEFSDSEAFFNFISDSVSATVANLTLMRTIETGSGFEPRIGAGFEFALIDRFTNVESSLGYLNDELKDDSLVDQGLDGTRQGALDARGDARNLLDDIASVTDTFLGELKQRIDIAGMIRDAYEIIDEAHNGEFSTGDAATLLSVGVVPKATKAIKTVKIIGQYVGELSIRLMMTTHAWGIAGVQRGDPISLSEIDAIVPDVDSILAELDPTEDRWGEFQ